MYVYIYDYVISEKIGWIADDLKVSGENQVCSVFL
jgi:hypothetical protein